MTTAIVIGHGRSPEGRNWGKRIDDADCVIRMWDFTWQRSRDHGVKYDYGLFEIGGDLADKAMRHKKRDPDKGWLASLLYGRTDKVPPNTEVVDQTPWNEIGKQLGGKGATGRLQFTRGTIAACWAIEKGAWTDIVLVGMDIICNGKSLGLDRDFSKAYQANPGSFTFNGWRAGAQKFGNHDFIAERRVIEALAEKHGVGVSFAQEAW